MAFNNDVSLSYHVFKDYNISFDERSNSVGTVRKVAWLKGNATPDESKAKIEIRKVTATPDGEKQLKGYSFSSEEGVHELVDGLVDAGFGNTKKVLLGLVKRDDFKDTLDNINNDPDDNGATTELFDMRSLLLGLANDNEDDD